MRQSESVRPCSALWVATLLAGRADRVDRVGRVDRVVGDRHHRAPPRPATLPNALLSAMCVETGRPGGGSPHPWPEQCAPCK